MNVVKLSPSHHRSYVNEALEDENNNVWRARINVAGGQIGPISDGFLLSGLLGLSSRSVIVIGINFNGTKIEVQPYKFSDEAIESFARKRFVNYPGIKAVEYSCHEMDGAYCYVIAIRWEWSIQSVIQEALGGAYLSRPWSNVIKRRDTRLPFNFSESIINAYADRRRAVDPNAVELRFGAHELPALLGLENEPSMKAASEAAFGSNDGVLSAIYIRGWRNKNVAAAARELTEGSFGNPFKPISSIGGAPFPEHLQTASGDTNWVDKDSYLKKNAFSMGSGIFSIVDNVRQHFCRDEEVFGTQGSVPEEFDPIRFSEVLKELVVNAFCHGQWKVWIAGREDESTYAHRMALVHLGDRIELVNRTREPSYLASDIQDERACRLSALHVALKDINWAKGRWIGQKLVRHRLAGLGMPSPIFVRDGDLYRSILPLRDEFVSWGLPHSRNPEEKIHLAMLFGARLALTLTHLNEDVVASALFLSRRDARDILENLNKAGVLTKESAKVYMEWPIRRRALGFTLVDPDVARDFISRIEARMSLFPVAPYLSVGARFQLSVRSLTRLAEKDKAQYIQDVYDNELFSTEEARRMGARHQELLSG